MQNKQYILFVSGLDKNVKESDLHKLFTEYPVSYIKIAKDHQTKQSYGYAFIGIKNSANKAEEAIERFNYEKMPGYKKTIKVCWYNMDRSATKNKEDFNVFVKNIDKSVSHKEFHELYSQFGNIISLKVAEDDEGESQGYGYVLYETAEDAQKAVEATNGLNFHGKPLYAGKFIKNKEKKPLQFNNLFVKSIPLSYSEDEIKAIFAKYGELGSCLIRQITSVKDTVPEEKKKEILKYQYAFICYKNPECARNAIKEIPFLKLQNQQYNEALKSLAEKVKGKVSDDHYFRFPVFLIENFQNAHSLSESELEEAVARFNDLLKEYDGTYIIKDKSDRFEVCRALKKQDREKRIKAIYEKIKKQIREKYKLCNLYVKNLPDTFDDEDLRKLFEPFGSIRSCKAIRKELITSYLGIKRSVKVFGYVCFNDKASAHEAKKGLENKVLQGAGKLYVDYHQTKEERNEFLKLNMINKSQKMRQQGGVHMRQLQGPVGPNMMRKFPNQMDMNNMNMNMNMNMPPNYDAMMGMQQYQMMGMMPMNMVNMPMQMPIGGMPIQMENINELDSNAKRDYYGEKLYNKISANPTYQNFHEFYSKIVGIFLDLEDVVIEKLIHDDHYFDLQVRETIRLLAERDQ